MAETRVNANELARQTGLPASTIKKIRNRDNPNPTLTTLLPIAKFFSISLSRLVGDEPLTHIHPVSHSQKKHRVPVLTWEEAIHWKKNHSAAQSIFAIEHAYSEQTYALIVEEDDWENLAKETILLIDPKTEPKHRDYVITHKKGQKVPTLKQLLHDDGKKYLKPIIQGYNIATLTSDHKILGVAMEYRKQLKKSE